MKTILFRFDLSRQVGMGHAIRLKNLSKLISEITRIRKIAIVTGDHSESEIFDPFRNDEWDLIQAGKDIDVKEDWKKAELIFKLLNQNS